MGSRWHLLVLWAAVAGLVGCGPITFTVGSGPDAGSIQSTVVERDGAFVSNQVALVDVSGLIHNGRRRGLLSESENPVGRLHEQLEAARSDPRIKAVILRLNTPGGTVTASDVMYRQVQRFRRRSGKPVVALMMDVAASGGYYLACACDRVVAYPTSITGSIGVIMQTVSFKPALDRIGIRADAITSGPNKAAGSPLGELTAEHRRLLQEMVNDFYAAFVKVVAEARPQLAGEQLARATDGRVFTGTQALGAGLVDATGDLYDAFALAKQLAGVQRAHLVMLHRPGRSVGSVFAAGGGPPAGLQVNLAQFNLPGLVEAGDTPLLFMYVWRPQLP
ncbi:MAG: signal peptide peptidase SppA [Phycisphaerae bacterium]|nr:signal peptide peptidase SppA [Phycisphaerae bacterium]